MCTGRRECLAQRTRNPIALMGCSHLPFCDVLQGGGVFVGGVIVTFDNSKIFSNTANNDVRAFLTRHHTPLSHCPIGVLAYVLRSNHVCMHWWLRLSSGGMCHRDLKPPHHPDGVLAFYSVWSLLAGRWRLCPKWAGDLPVDPNLQQPCC